MMDIKEIHKLHKIYVNNVIVKMYVLSLASEINIKPICLLYELFVFDKEKDILMNSVSVLICLKTL